MTRKEYKLAWQRKKRREFKEKHGYSLSRHYDNQGLRDAVLQRDNYRCVECGMTAEEHLKKWGRPITIHHKNKNHKDNRLENMETLCLSCHGRKDISPHLIEPKVPNYKKEIIWLRAFGFTIEDIADYFNFSAAAVWKWLKRWEPEVEAMRLMMPEAIKRLEHKAVINNE
ncbi:Homeodomain-like domain-containing protein [Carboxydocella thermautotrophica]|nr:Homeodomain-like domain-containing protein [Carboxydocella thermautotrophica]GAW29771.1 HNH endonuclease [Carboxydocella sp. ULO1]